MMKKNLLNKVSATVLAGMMLCSIAGCGEEVDAGTAETSQEVLTLQEVSEDAGSAATSDDAGKTATSVDTESSDDPYINKVLSVAGNVAMDVQETLVDDFDGDGDKEAFVFLGGEVEDVLGSNGSLWFVSDDSCEQVLEQKNIAVNEKGSVFEPLTVENMKFVKLTEAYISEAYSKIFYVKDGKCEESRISGTGYLYTDEKVDDFLVSHPAYDMCVEYEIGADESEKMVTGHTWKNYYAYFDKDKQDFCYYGAHTITEEELVSICGMDLATEIRNEGFQVDDIYRVDNGVVIVNYSKKTQDGNTVSIEYHNASFYEKNKQFLDFGTDGDKPWQKSDQGGIYSF